VGNAAKLSNKKAMNSISRTRLTKSLKTISIDKDDLKKLLGILQLRAISASEFEMRKAENQELDNIDTIKTNLKICSELKVKITGFQNEEIFGTIDEVFNFPSFPEKINSVYVSSDVVYRTNYNYIPEIFFRLYKT
jgi:hypothetical protein